MEFQSHHQPHHSGFWFVLSHLHHHSPSPSRHNSPSAASNNLATSPSPPMRDVSQTNNTSLPQERGHSCSRLTSEAREYSPAPPFLKGCSWLVFAQRREWGLREGGPMNWEAHPVRNGKRTMMKIVVRFLHFFTHSIPLTIHQFQPIEPHRQ